ncbi:hypothetical protein FZEAL_223 [Fusarium zealandicum]|uniref:Uncharacterized protein n=1 Tax=Fusarium zealandicum TaxID=1053134 RepID=A0A8H4UVC4_9HYPO|nr:hypothetical protein FZEAL_223 [Fusarium zealandicum]
MNPCAPTFIPIVASSDTGLDGDEPCSHLAKESSRPVRTVRSPRKIRLDREPRPSALDPDKYDSMFPSLRSAYPVKERVVRSSRPTRTSKMKHKRIWAKRVSKHSLQGGTSKQSRSITDDRSLDEVGEAQGRGEEANGPGLEFLKPVVYVPDEPAPELLKPTVYTPPASTHIPQGPFESDNDEPPSPKSTTAKGMPAVKSPRVRLRRPPTPHPDHRNRSRRSQNMAPTITRSNTPAGLVVPMVPAPHNPYIFGPPVQGPPPPGGFAPPYMPYPIVPWGMPPLVQPLFLPPPPGYGPSYPVWPHPIPMSGQSSQPPPQHRPKSRESSTRSESRSTSRSTRETSVPFNVAMKTASVGSLRTQAHMIKGSEWMCSSPVSTSTSSRGSRLLMVPVASGETHASLGASESRQKASKGLDKEPRELTSSVKSSGFVPTRQVQDALESTKIIKNTKPKAGDGLTRHDQRAPQVKISSSRNPPLNAPRGPSSRRQPITSAQQSLTLIGPEAGAWSQSKRWTSTATKERQVFQKMMANLRYMGSDRSPFVPQNPSDLTAFKVTIAEALRLKLAEEVKRRVARANARSTGNSKGKGNQPLGVLLRGKQYSDKLSPVFAADNCFNKYSPGSPLRRVPWPSLAELKEGGDKRTIRQGRCLPMPREHFVAPGGSTTVEDACNLDGTVRWQKKVAVERRYIRAVTEIEPSVTPPVQLQIDDIPFILRTMLHEINKEEIDGEEAKNEEEKVEQEE